MQHTHTISFALCGGQDTPMINVKFNESVSFFGIGTAPTH